MDRVHNENHSMKSPLVFLLLLACFAQTVSANYNAVLPQFVDGGNPSVQQWQTILVVSNPGDVTVQAGVQFHLLFSNEITGQFIQFKRIDPRTNAEIIVNSGDLNNFSLSPHQTLTFRSTMASRDVVQGFAVVNASDTIGTVVRFRILVNGKPQQEVSTLPLQPATQVLTIADVDTGIALVLPGAPPFTTITAIAKIYDQSGGLCFPQYPNGVPIAVGINIPPQQHFTFVLRDKMKELQASLNVTELCVPASMGIAVHSVTSHSGFTSDNGLVDFYAWALSGSEGVISSMPTVSTRQITTTVP
jgi:hypothetical protein